MENTLEAKVQKALDEIRPFLQSDGGDIALVGIEGNTVKVQLQGNCLGCHINQLTLRGGVEMTVKKYAPEIEKVVAVDNENA